MKSDKPFTFITWREGKHYVSQCLNIDISSFGNTQEESLYNVKEAVALYLEDADRKKIQSVEMPSITITSDLPESQTTTYA